MFEFSFVKPAEFSFTFSDDRAFEQVGVIEHKLDSFVFGRRLELHIPFTIKRAASVQKRFDGIVADNFAQLFFRERDLAVIPLDKLHFFRLQETSRFTASRSVRFVDETNFVGHFS